MFAGFLILIAVLFATENNYVGKSALDPTAKALPLQCWTAVEGEESVPCGEPYIYYKLKMPENGTD